MLAIVDGFKEWRRYLEGAKHLVTVFTDHKNLEIFETKNLILNRIQDRWSLFLAGFNFKIIYQKGTENGKANALSKHSQYVPKGGGSAEN